MIEKEYWALAPQARSAGIVKSRMGQLAKLCNDYKRALNILKSALKTSNPSAYIGKVIANIKEEQAPPKIKISPDTEPDIATQARLHGWPVRKIVRTNGTLGWYVAGCMYDQEGRDVGA